MCIILNSFALFIAIIFLVFTQNFAALQPSQSQKPFEVKSPLLQSLAPEYGKDSNTSNEETISGDPEDYNIKGTAFLNSFLKHLETRRTQNPNITTDQANRLVLSIRDGSSSAVDIELIPRLYSNEDQQNWNSIVNLLADSLAFIVQEAERMGYDPSFKYSVSLGEIQPYLAFGPGLSANALKSAAG